MCAFIVYLCVRYLLHSTESAFAYVLPLCFRALRLNLRDPSKTAALHAVRLNFMLDCMPSAHFDMEKTVNALSFAVKYAALFLTFGRACWTGTSTAKEARTR
jgi:hypothetical protein